MSDVVRCDHCGEKVYDPCSERQSRECSRNVGSRAAQTSRFLGSGEDVDDDGPDDRR